MSLASGRHSANLPRGFVPPPPMPRDPDATVCLPPESVRLAIELKSRVYMPAWKVSGSGIDKPSPAKVRELARLACAHRNPVRKAFASAWLTWCLLGGEEAPRPSAFKLPPSEARAIARRFANAGAFDPRDFHGVPF